MNMFYILFDRNLYFNFRIYKFGATLTEWRVGEKEIIFLSPKAVMDGKKAIRWVDN